jgi:hypothetical protein
VSDPLLSRLKSLLSTWDYSRPKTTSMDLANRLSIIEQTFGSKSDDYMRAEKKWADKIDMFDVGWLDGAARRDMPPPIVKTPEDVQRWREGVDTYWEEAYGPGHKVDWDALDKTIAQMREIENTPKRESN